MALRLRRVFSLSCPLLKRSLHKPKPISPKSSHFLSTLISTTSPAAAVIPSSNQLTRSFTSTSALFAKIFDPETDDVGPDTILFPGCDYNHWLITVGFKDPSREQDPDNISREQKIDTYVNLAAKIFGSVEEAKKRIYALSTTTYQGFQVECTEEVSERFKEFPEVVFVLPDSYIDPVNKEYGGDKYINGEIIPRPPPVHYGRQNRDRRKRDDFGSQPQQNYGPPRQQNYGPPRQQNHGPPQEQNYGSPQHQNYGTPQQQNYGSPQHQNYGPPQQQNYGPQQQQNYGPPQQQNYGPSLQKGYGPPRQQRFEPPQQQNNGLPRQQGYGLPQEQSNVPPKEQSNVPPQQQRFEPPQQQNNGLPRQQGYGPPQEQSYAPPKEQSNVPPHQQNNVPPQQQGYASQQSYGAQGSGDRRNFTPPSNEYQGGSNRTFPRNQYSEGQRDFQQGNFQRHVPYQQSGFSQDAEYGSSRGGNFEQAPGPLRNF